MLMGHTRLLEMEVMRIVKILDIRFEVKAKIFPKSLALAEKESKKSGMSSGFPL